MTATKTAGRSARPKSRQRASARRAESNGRARPGAGGRGRPRALANSQYPPALLRKIQEIQEDVSRLSKHEVQAYLDIGRKVTEILSDFDTYQVKRYSELEDLFASGRDVIGSSYRLRQKFTDDDINKLLKLKNPTTHTGLHRAHFVILSRVRGGPEKMHKLADQTVTQNWTTKQLAKRLLQEQGRSKRDKGGRRLVPETLVAIVRQQIDVANSFITKDLRVWQHKERGMSAQFEKLDKTPGGPDYETMNRIDELVPLFQSMSTRIAIIISDYLHFRERYVPARAAAAGGG